MNCWDGFPLTLSGNHYGVSAVSDIDNDGRNELIVNNEPTMYVFQTDGKPENTEWGIERHNHHNTGEYTKPCHSVNVTSDAVWTENKSICGDLTVYSGSTLKVENCTVNFGENSTVTLKDGAALEIDAAVLQSVSVNAQSGSSLKISGDGKIYLREGGEFEMELGALLEINYGEIVHP